MISLIGAKGPLSTDKFEELETATLIVSTSKLFMVESERVYTFIFNQGSFVLDKLTGLSEDELVEFIGDVGKLFLEAIDGIAAISAERVMLQTQIRSFCRSY